MIILQWRDSNNDTWNDYEDDDILYDDVNDYDDDDDAADDDSDDDDQWQSMRATHVALITVTSWWAQWYLKSPVSRLFVQLLSWRRSKKFSKLRVTGRCEGNSPVTRGFRS